MSLALKITTLFIRTAAKPIANLIKRQARENPPFRRVCISFAQRLHRLDIRLRLGLLQDPAAIDAQIAREAEREAAREAARNLGKEVADAAKAKRSGGSSSSSATSASSASSSSAESTGEVVTKTQKLPETAEEFKATVSEQAQEKKKEISDRLKKEADEKSKSRRAKIRPLSEAKAIDSGATFISESFLFLIGVGAILGERWWSSKKDSARREGVDDRLANLEKEMNGWKERALKAEEEGRVKVEEKNRTVKPQSSAIKQQNKEKKPEAQKAG